MAASPWKYTIESIPVLGVEVWVRWAWNTNPPIKCKLQTISGFLYWTYAYPGGYGGIAARIPHYWGVKWRPV